MATIFGNTGLLIRMDLGGDNIYQVEVPSHQNYNCSSVNANSIRFYVFYL